MSWSAFRPCELRRETLRKSDDVSRSREESRRRIRLKKLDKLATWMISFLVSEAILRGWICCHLLSFSDMSWRFRQYNSSRQARTLWLSSFIVISRSFSPSVSIFLLMTTKSTQLFRLTFTLTSKNCNSWEWWWSDNSRNSFRWTIRRLLFQ